MMTHWQEMKGDTPGIPDLKVNQIMPGRVISPFIELLFRDQSSKVARGIGG
jgi:hypothetical protein